jgi:hypothetical protein
MEARLLGLKTPFSFRRMETTFPQNLSRFQAQFFLTRRLISLSIFVLLMLLATTMHFSDSVLEMEAALDRKFGAISLLLLQIIK